MSKLVKANPDNPLVTILWTTSRGKIKELVTNNVYDIIKIAERKTGDWKLIKPDWWEHQLDFINKTFTIEEK